MTLASGRSSGLSTMSTSPFVFTHLVDDRRIRGDDVHVVLAPEPLLDDLHVQQAEEAAAEAEAERDARFGLEDEGGVVELELAHRRLEVLEVGGVDRIDAAEDHRLDLLEAGQRLGRGLRACR